MTSTPYGRGMAEEAQADRHDTLRNRLSLPNADPPPQWVTAALEEYKSLRAEIVDSIQAQRQIMQIGLTGLSVLIGLGLQGINPLLAVLILALLVPTVAIFVTVGALGELFRAARASAFLAYREGIINLAIPGPAPAQEWEQWLRRRPIFIVRDRAEFLAVFSISTGSLALGFYLMFTSNLRAQQPAFLLVALVVVAMVLWTVGPILHLHMIRRARCEFLQTSIGE
jgi:hypothetical protein